MTTRPTLLTEKELKVLADSGRNIKVVATIRAMLPFVKWAATFMCVSAPLHEKRECIPCHAKSFLKKFRGK